MRRESGPVIQQLNVRTAGAGQSSLAFNRTDGSPSKFGRTERTREALPERAMRQDCVHALPQPARRRKRFRTCPSPWSSMTLRSCVFRWMGGLSRRKDGESERASRTELGFDLDLSTKRTRKRESLKEMSRVAPWSKLIALREPYYPKDKTGRQPFPIAMMLRIHFMQWFEWLRLDTMIAIKRLGFPHHDILRDRSNNLIMPPLTLFTFQGLEYAAGHFE